MDETFSFPTNRDYAVAWSVVRAIEEGRTPTSDDAARLARVIYAAERARKLLSGMHTSAERDQT
jgi:hypothetical protein